MNHKEGKARDSYSLSVPPFLPKAPDVYKRQVDTFGSVALQLNHLTVGYTGRNSDTYLFTVDGQYLFMRLSSCLLYTSVFTTFTTFG